MDALVVDGVGVHDELSGRNCALDRVTGPRITAVEWFLYPVLKLG